MTNLSWAELKDWEQNLLKEAKEARKMAYAPYSNYFVGAAILTEDGSIVRGANVENASYPLCVCAERSAAATAVNQGLKKWRAIAVVTKNGGSPCGGCRQVLNEFEPELLVLQAAENFERIYRLTLNELLPLAFGPKSLA